MSRFSFSDCVGVLATLFSLPSLLKNLFLPLSLCMYLNVRTCVILDKVPCSFLYIIYKLYNYYRNTPSSTHCRESRGAKNHNRCVQRYALAFVCHFRLSPFADGRRGRRRRLLSIISIIIQTHEEDYSCRCLLGLAWQNQCRTGTGTCRFATECGQCSLGLFQ